MGQVLIVAGAFLAAIYAYMKQEQRPTLSGRALIDDAITKGIVKPLGLPDIAGLALRVQSKLETGGWTAKSFQATNSLFNRHAGSGRGDWQGSGIPKSSYKLGIHIYYSNPGDADLRIYKDVYQSARDMAQLLSDPLYRSALTALKAGNPQAYFNAVAAAGFAADSSYAYSLTRMARNEGIV